MRRAGGANSVINAMTVVQLGASPKRQSKTSHGEFDRSTETGNDTNPLNRLLAHRRITPEIRRYGRSPRPWDRLLPRALLFVLVNTCAYECTKSDFSSTIQAPLGFRKLRRPALSFFDNWQASEIDHERQCQGGVEPFETGSDCEDRHAQGHPPEEAFSQQTGAQ